MLPLLVTPHEMMRPAKGIRSELNLISTVI
jgi:hypothetical protein